MSTPNHRHLLRAGLGCAVATLGVGAISIVVRAPLLFPAIGASTFLAFAFRHGPLSRLRNALAGHVVGLSCGWLAAVACGVPAGGAWLASGAPWAAVAACSLSLAASTVLMLILAVPHPPAGATTLIFASGLMQGWTDALAVVASVLVLVVVVRGLERFGPLREIPASNGGAT